MTSRPHHILTVTVENKPGVLSRVAGLFSRRAFNIFSLAVSPTDDERFAAYLADARRPDFAAMLLCRAEDDAIVGFFNLSQIVRRRLQSAYLGYAVGQPFAGQGYMREGIALVLGRCPAPTLVESLQAIGSTEVYLLLVGSAGWSEQKYQGWLADTFGTLLADTPEENA